MRKRVLVVNAFFDEYWRTTGTPHRVPGAMGHVYLAGAFNPATTEVRVCNEQHSGPLRDRALLGWPDLLVVSAETSSFDQMLRFGACAHARDLRLTVVDEMFPCSDLAESGARNIVVAALARSFAA